MRTLLLLTLAVWLSACATSTPNTTLYQRLGGAKGLDKIVYQYLVNVAHDDRVIERFKGVDIEHFRKGFTAYLCALADGGCIYKDDTMRQVHAGNHYTATEFNAIVDDLIRAMDSENVPTRAQNALLARLAPTYKDIVYQ